MDQTEGKDEATVLLAEVDEMLRIGGYTMRLDRPDGETLDLTIVPGPEACPECLVPQEIMRNVVAELLQPAGLSVGRIVYPVDDAHY